MSRQSPIHSHAEAAANAAGLEHPHGPCMLGQSVRQSHVEAVCNAVVGVVLAQAVLWAFGMPVREALSLNAVMFIVSFLRSLIIRRAFAGIS